VVYDFLGYDKHNISNAVMLSVVFYSSNILNVQIYDIVFLDRCIGTCARLYSGLPQGGSAEFFFFKLLYSL
jgi:hypothetical protein